MKSENQSRAISSKQTQITDISKEEKTWQQHIEKEMTTQNQQYCNPYLLFVPQFLQTLAICTVIYVEKTAHNSSIISPNALDSPFSNINNNQLQKYIFNKLQVCMITLLISMKLAKVILIVSNKDFQNNYRHKTQSFKYRLYYMSFVYLTASMDRIHHKDVCAMILSQIYETHLIQVLIQMMDPLEDQQLLNQNKKMYLSQQVIQKKIQLKFNLYIKNIYKCILNLRNFNKIIFLYKGRQKFDVSATNPAYSQTSATNQNIFKKMDSQHVLNLRWRNKSKLIQSRDEDEYMGKRGKISKNIQNYTFGGKKEYQRKQFRKYDKIDDSLFYPTEVKMPKYDRVRTASFAKRIMNQDQSPSQNYSNSIKAQSGGQSQQAINPNTTFAKINLK